MYNVAIVGNDGTGKTSFIHRCVTGDFTMQYNATNKCEYSTVNFEGESFNVAVGDRSSAPAMRVLNMCDVPGQLKYQDFDEVYKSSDAVVIFFSFTSRLSYKGARSWYRKVRKVNSSVPVILCGNKIDLADTKEYTYFCQTFEDGKVTYEGISVKKGNHDALLQHLIEVLK